VGGEERGKSGRRNVALLSGGEGENYRKPDLYEDRSIKNNGRRKRQNEWGKKNGGAGNGQGYAGRSTKAHGPKG